MHKQYTSMTQDERQERDEARRADAKRAVDGSVQALLAEVRAGKSERYVEWLRFSSLFHHYSPANQWLLISQCQARGIHASHIASYKTWQAQGFSVQKGEKALYIWAPRPYTKEVENKQTGEKEDRAYAFFVLVPVFDASQIAQGEGYKPLPQFFYPLPDSEQARHLYTALVQVATNDGFTCLEEERTDTVQGWSRDKTICVRSGRDDLSVFLTLIHEYAHGLLHWDGVERSKQQKEAEAESVAYVVSAHFGLHNPFSSDYLINWGNDEKSLMAYMDRISKTAHAIIAKIEEVEAKAETALENQEAA